MRATGHGHFHDFFTKFKLNFLTVRQLVVIYRKTIPVISQDKLFKTVK